MILSMPKSELLFPKNSELKVVISEDSFFNTTVNTNVLVTSKSKMPRPPKRKYRHQCFLFRYFGTNQKAFPINRNGNKRARCGATDSGRNSSFIHEFVHSTLIVAKYKTQMDIWRTASKWKGGRNEKALMVGKCICIVV